MLLPSTAFGGEEGPDKFDPNIRYRGSLQNYLIDTGDEVILVDTGLPAGTPEEMSAAELQGVAFEDLPDDWKCPRCRQPKEKFNRA